MIDTPPMPSAPLLEVRGLSKQFPGVKALQNVNLTLGRGEILAVVGENGAGKSTLMKILAGVQRPDSGEILLEGEPQSFGSVDDSLDAGISLIHQELNLSDNLDVAANIFLGREPHRWGLLDRKQICNRANAHLKQVGLKRYR